MGLYDEMFPRDRRPRSNARVTLPPGCALPLLVLVVVAPLVIFFGIIVNLVSGISGCNRKGSVVGVKQGMVQQDVPLPSSSGDVDVVLGDVFDKLQVGMQKDKVLTLYGAVRSRIEYGDAVGNPTSFDEIVVNGDRLKVRLAFDKFDATLCGAVLMRAESKIRSVGCMSLGSLDGATGGEKLAVINDPDGYTNIRQGRDTTTQIVARVVNCEVFYVIPQEGRWWQVRTRSGSRGFMYYNRIRVID